MRWIPLMLALVMALAGCIQLPDDTTSAASSEARAASTGGEMTGRETVEQEAGPCTEGGISVGGERNEAFCATRTVTVAGTISGFDLLDVALSTFNGDVVIEGGPEGEWGFVATLRARGQTVAEAEERLDKIQLDWAHESNGEHFLEAEVRTQERTNNGRYEAHIHATLPRSLTLLLAGTTSNGGVTATGITARGLALTSSNGNVVADADVAQAALQTSNGEVDARLRPFASGNFALTTSNGEITLQVPEGARHGYSLEGTTSNGEVEITLRDGELGPCPKGSQYYTPPCNHRTFRTSGYDGREIRTQVQMVTSNGDVNAGPA